MPYRLLPDDQIPDLNGLEGFVGNFFRPTEELFVLLRLTRMNRIILLGRKEMKAVKRRKNMREVKRKKFTRIYTEVKMKNAITDSSPCRKQKQKRKEKKVKEE
jgi:hypothetical protein